MRLEPKTKLYSVRQTAQLTGKMERTIHRYMIAGTIDYFAVDHLRFIPEFQIEKIKNIKLYYRSRHNMPGHVSIVKFALLMGTKPYNIKAYVKRGQLEHITDDNGIFFIPDHLVAIWKQFEDPTPGKIEAATLKGTTVQNAGMELGYSDSKIRLMVANGELKKIQGTFRWYVLQDSIDKYKLVLELAKGL